MREAAGRHRQKGAVIITVAMLTLFLLGFMGFALDFGRLFVVKTELQTAMDACALAGAQELDGLGDSLTRATSAGLTAGNLNKVNLQSATWSGQGQLIDTEITFRAADYSITTMPALAKYVQCQHVQPNVQLWLLQSMGAFFGDAATFPSTLDVMASAVATRGSTQTTCPIPVALKPKTDPATCFNGDCSAPNYGFQIGEWVQIMGDKEPNSGEMGWYNLDGSTNAREARDQLEGGSCGTEVGDVLGTPGAKTGLDVAWNYRFGIYKNNAFPSEHHPDFSGYAYTSTNWKNAVPQNAWSGTPAPGSDPTADNFLAKRAAYASYDDQGTDLDDGSRIAFGDPDKLKSGGFKKLATPGTGGEHQQHGFNRRISLVPVINASSAVIDYVCVFMLHPLTGPAELAFVEFRGNAAAASSPCTTNGIPGGLAGPLVPVLVR